MASEAADFGQRLETTEFVKEAHRLDQLPADQGNEIAFVGRSNAGKSSVVNRLCNRRNLARTSRTPGRTQQFVVFEFGPEQRIIDLPGFGFAKVSKTKRRHWDTVIPQYLQRRRSLIGLVLVVDARHPFKSTEQEIIGWCIAADLPVLVLLNKADKLNQRETAAALKAIKREIGEGDDLVAVQMFSAQTGKGVESALAAIKQWFEHHAALAQNSLGQADPEPSTQGD